MTSNSLLQRKVQHWYNIDDDKKCQSKFDYSHSVVPGGFDVRSYNTLEIPCTVKISDTILLITCIELSNNY